MTTAINNNASEHADAQRSNRELMLSMGTILAELQQGNQQNAVGLKEALATFKNSQEESDTVPVKAKEVDTHDTTIAPFTDDMNRNLTIGRFLPVGTDLAYQQSLVPKTSYPLRTNYSLGELGLMPSQYRGIIAAHERAATTLQLKMFRPENLSRIEDSKTWSISRNKFTQKADEIDIGKTAFFYNLNSNNLFPQMTLIPP